MWVSTPIAALTERGERCQLWVTPANYPVPVTNLPGCVHRVNQTKILQIKHAFMHPQWAHVCQVNNHYAGSMVEVTGSQAKMTTDSVLAGPFRLL